MTSKNGTSFWNLRSLQGVCEKNRVPLIKLYFNKDQQDDAQNENYLHDNNFEYISEKHLKTSAAEFTYATAVALIGPFETKVAKQLDAIQTFMCIFELVVLTSQMYWNQ